MKRMSLFVLGLAAALVLVPTTAVADSATHSYVLAMDAPNLGVAPNGDQIAISGETDFTDNPKSVEGGGSFTHMNPAELSSPPGPGRRRPCSTTSLTAAAWCSATRFRRSSAAAR